EDELSGGSPSDISEMLAQLESDSDHDAATVQQPPEKKAKKDKKDKKDRNKKDKDQEELPVKLPKAKDKKPQTSGGDKKPQLSFKLVDQHGNEVVGPSFSQVQLLKLQGLITHHCETLVCDLCEERAVILSFAKLSLVCEQQSQQIAGQGQASAAQAMTMTIRPAGPLWASWKICTVDDFKVRKREPQFADEFGKARNYHLNPDMIRSFREEELDKVKRTGTRVETYFIFFSMSEFEQTFGLKATEHEELSHLITTEEDEFGNEITGVVLRDPEMCSWRLETLFDRSKAEELKRLKSVNLAGSGKKSISDMGSVEDILGGLLDSDAITIESDNPNQTPGLALPGTLSGQATADEEAGKNGSKKRKDLKDKDKDKQSSKPPRKSRKDDDTKSATSKPRGQDAIDRLMEEHKANLNVAKVLNGTVSKQQLYFISKFIQTLEKKGNTVEAADLEREHLVCTAALMLTPGELAQIPLEQVKDSQGIFDVVHPMLKDCNHTSMSDKLKIFEKAFLGKILPLVREGKEGQEKLALASQCGARCLEVLSKSAAGFPVADGYASAQTSVRQALTSVIGLVAISSNGSFVMAGSTGSGGSTSTSSGTQILSSNAVKSLSDEKSTTSVLYSPLVCS
ncbi:unnamed protein product, partial [Symbiodinium necroappetens]